MLAVELVKREHLAAVRALRIEQVLRVHGGAEKPCLRAQNHVYRYLFDEGRHRTLGAECFDEAPVLERWQDLRRDSATDEDARQGDTAKREIAGLGAVRAYEHRQGFHARRTPCLEGRL